jgi:N-acetyl sugar amidotransferase
MERKYQICKRCVMDTTDPNIVFDENGICNHCTSAIERMENVYFLSKKEKEKIILSTIEKIKKDRKGKYDCIIGLSGGVDSTYVAYLLKSWGLNPLAIHLDNGWNSELAQQNIENTVKKLNIDLHTVVLNWDEFKELQLAFLRSSVIDLEMLSDNAILATIYKMAKKFKIKYFLDGVNQSTESIMPESWFYSLKIDTKNIKSIYKINGDGGKIKEYPFLSIIDVTKILRGNFKQFSPLNYIEYNKDEVKEFIKSELNWRDYGGKHYESRITQFYQAYILPRKYNVDKRKAHLSSMICSKQITRDSALEVLKTDLYDLNKLTIDRDFFCKKLGLTLDEFDSLMKCKPIAHSNYPSYLDLYKRISKYRNFLKCKELK